MIAPLSLLTALVGILAAPVDQISCNVKCHSTQSSADCICETRYGLFSTPSNHSAVGRDDISVRSHTTCMAPSPLGYDARRRSSLQTGGVVTGPLAVYDSSNVWDGITPGADIYNFYSGNGESGWPDKSQWISFADMFDNYKSLMRTSCVTNSWAQDVSEAEIGDIWNSIQQVASETFVDHRFILAVVMQESNGCVRAPTKHSPAPDFVRNPGLMQSHNGAGICNDNGEIIPCPGETILQMIRDGAGGTNDGEGLAQCINRAGASDTSGYYKAARLYNSGSIDPSGDLGGGVATHCYASDIANRLTGWVHAAPQCPL